MLSCSSKLELIQAIQTIGTQQRYIMRLLTVIWILFLSFEIFEYLISCSDLLADSSEVFPYLLFIQHSRSAISFQMPINDFQQFFRKCDSYFVAITKWLRYQCKE